MGRPKNPPPPPGEEHDKESRFASSPNQRALIKQAAKIKRLKPATYMRRIVLEQAQRDIADELALIKAQTVAEVAEISPGYQRAELASEIANAANILLGVAEKLGRVENN